MPEDLYLTIEEWSPAGNFVRVIARTDDLKVARASFAAATREFPQVHIKLRNRGLILDERKPGGPPAKGR